MTATVRPQSRARPNGRNTLRVLTYHRVANPEDTPTLNPRLISATPAVFAQQMEYLARRYHVVSLPQVHAAVVSGATLPRRAVLITFDDAYMDFGDIAWPILRRLRLPVTLAVPTAFPDQPTRSFWWDRLFRALVRTSRQELHHAALGRMPLGTIRQRRAAFERTRQHCHALSHQEATAVIDDVCLSLGPEPPDHPSVLGWDRLRELAREGVSLCAHTRTHPVLTRLPPEQAREEITGSFRDLQREIGDVTPAFCFPHGAHNDVLIAMLRQAGCAMAFTQIDGHNDLDTTDPLRLCRTNITRRTSVTLFRVRLLRWVAYVDRWRHRA